ncbi:MAG: peptidoglycan-binding protein, partial [Rhodospirillales bacterium]
MSGYFMADVFASAANYLSSIGWNDDETWGREVRLPADFDLDLIDLSIRKHISEWQALGVRRADGSNLPAADIEGALVLPSGYQGPAFLVYGNYDAILTWNRSTYSALAVGYLSDRLVGRGRLVAERPANDQPLHRDDILDLQRLLNENGYDSGMPDGLIGTMTRNAVRDYQRAVGLPPDGYPTHGLLTRLRGG